MSDGPFMSPLPDKCWSSVLERAANEAYTVEQIREAIGPALGRRVRDLPPAFVSFFKAVTTQADDGLFKACKCGEIEALRNAAETNDFALLISDWCEDFFARDSRPGDAASCVLASTLDEHWGDAKRQLEEYAQREAIDRAIGPIVRERLRQATLSREEIEALAQSLLDPLEATPSRAAPQHDAIEDGPNLSSDNIAPDTTPEGMS